MIKIIDLSYWDLLAAALLVVLLGVLSVWLRLGIARQISISAIRTTVQLLLVGLILKILFDNVALGWITLMASVMLLVAGREVMKRQHRRFQGWWGYGLGTLSMFISSFSVTLIVLLTIIGNEPWYAPQYAIPLLGMMLGNTMSGISLALDRLTQLAWERRLALESRLAMGQTAMDAVGDIRRDATRVGMMPMINAMAAAGIISLPGMMTGQILAGSPPLLAVKYQILIMFMITAGTGFATILAVSVGSQHLFDKRERLRLERLSLPD